MNDKKKMFEGVTIPLLVVGNGVLLPGSSLRIPVTRKNNIAMVRQCLLHKSTIGSVMIGVIPHPHLINDSEKLLVDKKNVGTLAVVVQVAGTNWPEPSFSLMVTGLCRFRINHIVQQTPFLLATISRLNDNIPDENRESTRTLMDKFMATIHQLMEQLDVSVPLNYELKKKLEGAPRNLLPDICANIVDTSFSELLDVLNAETYEDRVKTVLPLIERQIQSMNLGGGTQREIPVGRALVRDLSRVGRRGFSGVEEALGGLGEEDSSSLEELESRLKDANLPDVARAETSKELKRLKRTPPHMPDYSTIRSYLELMSDLPWSQSCKETLEIQKARDDLNRDHHGMEKVKKRVLEYLAVRKLRSSHKGPILCFVGPPGVGKTSIGRSIASSLGKPFHRISLGGVCDQSDIRGHRRTYVGSMPGRIIQGLKHVKANNPVFLLDEIDKLNKGHHGDPAAALLEVLDPEQNSEFVDHYVNVPFNLSSVLFIATANTAATIPPALRDRMELIHVPGYTLEEKLKIAENYLVSKQIRENGLTEKYLTIPVDTIKHMVNHYTSESGVRSLERCIAAVCRAVAVRVAEAQGTSAGKGLSRQASSDPMTVEAAMSGSGDSLLSLPFVIDEAALEDILGSPRHGPERWHEITQAGVAIGMAWTAHGGELMYVEATKMRGTGKLILTGQLGDVIKESAHIALDWLRAHANLLGVESGSDAFEATDVHIHFPAGAIAKDGPSAGVTIVTALTSLFTGRVVRSDVAMTGELTLRGVLLPVGGIKEKVLAARRAGITTIIIPVRNAKDLVDIPKIAQEGLTFVYAAKVEEVLQVAFKESFSVLPENNIPIPKNASSKL